MAEDRITESVTVPVSPDRAFAAFVDDLATWWPREYTWASDTLESIAIEEGGRCFEEGPHGFTWDWGRVTAVERPFRLVVLWQINPDRTPQPDPAKASEVEVHFEPGEPSCTRVALEHREFDRHGEASEAYREGMSSPQGWAYCLERYAASLG